MTDDARAELLRLAGRVAGIARDFRADAAEFRPATAAECKYAGRVEGLACVAEELARAVAAAVGGEGGAA